MAIFEGTEVFYNRVRFHGFPGDKSPVDFETQLNQNNALWHHPDTVRQVEARPSILPPKMIARAAFDL
jgi:hypothetical protein